MSLFFDFEQIGPEADGSFLLAVYLETRKKWDELQKVFGTILARMGLAYPPSPDLKGVVVPK